MDRGAPLQSAALGLTPASAGRHGSRVPALDNTNEGRHRSEALGSSGRAGVTARARDLCMTRPRRRHIFLFPNMRVLTHLEAKAGRTNARGPRRTPRSLLVGMVSLRLFAALFVAGAGSHGGVSGFGGPSRVVQAVDVSGTDLNGASTTLGGAYSAASSGKAADAAAKVAAVAGDVGRGAGLLADAMPMGGLENVSLRPGDSVRRLPSPPCASSLPAPSLGDRRHRWDRQPPTTTPTPPPTSF